MQNYGDIGFGDVFLRVERKTPTKMSIAAPTRSGVNVSAPITIAKIAASKGCK